MDLPKLPLKKLEKQKRKLKKYINKLYSIFFRSGPKLPSRLYIRWGGAQQMCIQMFKNDS